MQVLLKGDVFSVDPLSKMATNPPVTLYPPPHFTSQYSIIAIIIFCMLLLYLLIFPAPHPSPPEDEFVEGRDVSLLPRATLRHPAQCRVRRCAINTCWQDELI